MALLVDGEGKVYELEDEALEKYRLKNWYARRDEGFEFLDKVADLIKEYKKVKDSYDGSEEADVLGQGCCLAYPNYCPNN